MTREGEPALERLRGKRGRDYWRGLDALFDHADFRRRIVEVFPNLAGMAGDWRRRDILKCMGAAIAMAGLDGCERLPDEEALPYVDTPPGARPGEARYYATAVELDGVGQPVIGKTRDGRPIKLEGNPDHPASGGATDAFTQAALLGLYDPERSAAPRQGTESATWDAFDGWVRAEAERLDARGGAGFRLLTGPVGSPTLLRQIAAMRARWPEMRWHVHAPLGGHFDEATRRAFGRPLERLLRLDLAEAVVSLDDDVLGPGPRQTFQARGWSIRRRAYQDGQGSALLFAAEPSPTLTGVTATDRLPAGHGRIPALLVAIASAFGVGGFTPPSLNARERAWVGAAVQALADHRGAGLLAVGEHQPPELQQLGFAINDRLGNVGTTLRFIEPATPADARGTLAELTRDMRAGRVETLFVLDSNPVYTAPSDLDFGQAIKRVPRCIHAGLHFDETAALSHWHVPLTHLLESWSDTRAADGSVVLIQPLVRPFLDVRSRHALLAAFTGEPQTDREIVRATWAGPWGDELDQRWQRALVGGWIPDSAGVEAAVGSAAPPQALPKQDSDTGLTVVIRPDPTIHDGSFAGNPWLQELPKPLTKITWDNAVHISPALAEELGLENRDVVELSVNGRAITGPVWVLPGLDPRSVLVHLGYGRSGGGRLAEGIGFDAYRLRTTDRPWTLSGAAIRRTGDRYELASTQPHTALEGEDFVRFVEAAGRRLPEKPSGPNFFPPQPRQSPSWGMSIDLDLCIGCNACVTACVAENNIPMVGKEQVSKGREMHWLRVDHYHEGPREDPRHVFQPVPCMHCEDAPCEMGCPVNATVHSPDGLNLQVYNRCIGTRTCSAYCPYKVRRFNWLDFTRDDPPEIRAVRNPEVTVRDRGVMEKCTYCIQRISEARIAAKIEGQPIPDGAVKTACQQVCPTSAIVFGDITEDDSAVSLRKADGRDYALLEEANTRPRTTYSARIAAGEDLA